MALHHTNRCRPPDNGALWGGAAPAPPPEAVKHLSDAPHMALPDVCLL